jgi:hypothetical protein|tara:strand:+ start:213 stop:371 length:159 start_codon:yes stop_codon:yes gene_type:complete
MENTDHDVFNKFMVSEEEVALEKALLFKEVLESIEAYDWFQSQENTTTLGDK